MGRAENRQGDSGIKLDSIYYKVVAGLLVILASLIIYIVWQDFSANTSKEPIDDRNTDVQEQKDASDSDQEQENQDESSQESESSKENTKKQVKKEKAEHHTPKKEKITEGVEKNAPLDETHEVSYEEGSSDMNEVLKLSKQVTGLGEDMYPVWIGNNGPGKVQATVSSQDNSKQFVVDLQFGEGTWHVTNVEQVSE